MFVNGSCTGLAYRVAASSSIRRVDRLVMAVFIKAYLVVYNLMCLTLWSIALMTGVRGYMDKGLRGVWGSSGSFILVGQFAMALEIVHAVLGLVRSPVLTTSIQVMSRLWIVVVPVLGSECKIGEEAMPGLMGLSWAAVEVVRYSFYLCSLLMSKVPYGLFWMRYTLFYVLYPTGITGELGTAMLGQECFGSRARLIGCVMALYVPGSPFMYMNMVGIRKSAFKKRHAPPPKAPRGCAFPAGKDGSRSTTAANKMTIAAAISASGDASAAEACRREPMYRFGYVKHFKKLVAVSAHSEENALAVARAGIKYMRKNFEFVDGQGNTVPFGQAVEAGSSATVEGRSLRTETIVGTAMHAVQALRVAYDGGWHPSTPKPPVKSVEGDELRALTELWVLRGVLEADAAKAIVWSANYVARGGSLKDCHFVLIGAGSAMGPFRTLMELGASVVAIDVPGSWGERPKAMWRRLIETARQSCGTLTFPAVDKSASGDELEARAGVDLCCEAREVADWLCEVWLPRLDCRRATVCVGNYTYLDGDQHVKLSLCADAVIDRLLSECRRRRVKQTTLAFLCTPTDLHLVPDDCALASKTNAETRPFRLAEKLIHLTTGVLRPNYTMTVGPPDQRAFVCDGLSVAQGPNYALAKRLQHWRASLAFAAGHVVSSNVAPSTATLSVIHNKSFAWAYGGMPAFNFEIFKQETTTAIMAAILIHDVLNDKSPKNPGHTKLHNPLALFSTQAVHGGLWRSPYAIDSIGEVSALVYFAQLIAQPILALAILAIAAHFAYAAPS